MFVYSNLKVSADELPVGESLTVSVDVTNEKTMVL